MRERLAFGGAIVALTLTVAGCGGGEEKRSGSEPAKALAAVPTPAPPEGAGKAFQEPATVQSPVPVTQGGNVVASSGFDAAKDGFAFQNYGRNRGPMLRPQEVRELFGDEVCVNASAASCTLTPTAERWRLAQNAAYEGGHCYGFSTLSLQMFRGVVKPSSYGGATTHALRIADASGSVTNPELAADLTRAAAMQSLGSIQRKSRRYTPTQAIERLRAAFTSGDKNLILSFYMPGEGGHAVVPVAVIDQGGGKFEIKMYDNNFPYFSGSPELSDRRMKIDTNADTWEYTISIRPDVPQNTWRGQGRNNPLKITRSEDQNLPQPCPFCDDASASTPTTVTLGGDAERHGHLRITDGEGNVTGYKDGELVNEIPGAQVVQPAVIQREFLNPEPLYELPSGGTYAIELVDVPDGAAEQAIHATGPGVGVGLTNIAEGTRLELGPDGTVGVKQDDGAASSAELDVAVEGNRLVTLEPASDNVKLTPRSGDDIRVSGKVENGKVENPATGRTSKIPGAGGTFDLSEAVGTKG
jgi:hypothetical protein